VIQDRTEAFHLFLIKALGGSQPREPFVQKWLRATQASDEEPEDRCIYLTYLGLCWGKAALICAAVVFSIGYLIARVDKPIGDGFTQVTVVFTTTFCITGGVDAIWRLELASSARRRYRRANSVVDKSCRRLMRIARLNNATILIQLAVASILAWRLA
jgi:hypothetical protein